MLRLMHTQTSSMFQQGLGQSLVWQWNVWIGRSPDGTCGATTALEWGDEMRPNKVRMNCPIKK